VESDLACGFALGGSGRRGKRDPEGSSLKVGSMTLRRRAVARCRPGFVEAVILPLCPPCSVLRLGPR
jgi:hypothetical protein